jgi:ABC-type ATPase with predicted acetyltransferase domain
MRIDVAHQFLPKQNSVRALQVMDHFGIAFEQGSHVIADGIELPIEPGMVVLFTGASGSGKSSLMRSVAASVPDAGQRDRMSPAPAVTTEDSGIQSPALLSRNERRLCSLDDLTLPDRILIDALPLPVPEAMGLLSACGLGEAQLMLRTPKELSDGQRYRFRLALALSQRPEWIVADEFTATLDRTLAKVVAYNIRRQCDRTGTGFLLATTHEDIAADLDPDVHVHCRLDWEITIETRSAACSAAFPGRTDVNAKQQTAWEGRPPRLPHSRSLSRRERGEVVKKKRFRSPTSCGSASRPVATGRTSRGGIIAAIISDSSG